MQAIAPDDETERLLHAVLEYHVDAIFRLMQRHQTMVPTNLYTVLLAELDEPLLQVGPSYGYDAVAVVLPRLPEEVGAPEEAFVCPDDRICGQAVWGVATDGGAKTRDLVERSQSVRLDTGRREIYTT